MVTTRSRYSLRAMIDIARHQAGGPVRAADIAERENISAGYLERLLKQLVSEGLVRSRKGPGGGYLLKRPAESITLDQILHSSGEDLAPVPCERQDCEQECKLYHTCSAREVWAGMREAAEQYLGRHRLSELLEIPRAGGKTTNGLRPLRSTAGSH
ncbi:MAG: Rrf2 family transcriptional regulator [candidate division WOR-3 bacterium]|nr:MAG: Rrf2 family transcriptional regulator [candidate division WOR-3 bacterium]